ncbi:TPA: tail assembly protein [Salmonella enterica subsp. enterica serovar Weltevreden]|uniref:tail assembly protein n=1 Tax=Enterobacteriaceae TaxID=543 RepID=UPI000FC10A90|nr:tail assembly protein [Citrobacter freundii]ECA1871347.1 tail assembly protein [Salmonella enterica subsp. enterica serovar London]EEM6498413.1 tail assembly protein [Salmonella enterica]HEC6891104.1 tail assembly protein [Salmonella enterica subsp. enterica serovar Weltevreden]HEE9935002.1 tail assembly protein [Citrobacter braakii]ECD6795908.1 tail assembly protein [Salmonella enterica subsp. enterica serovar London]
MQEVMTRIELGGVLGKTFGKIHHRLISRVSEAGVALAKTIPGFEQFMISSQRRGLTYSVFKGKKNIGVDDLGFPVTGDVIRIVPVIIGSKKAGLIQTILGAVLVIASIWMPGLSIAASNMMFAAGASMTLGGVVQMLSPQATGLASKQSSDNRASYAFGGVTNTAAQGYPVPLGYGKRRIGGAIISAGIYVEDQQ